MKQCKNKKCGEMVREDALYCPYCKTPFYPGGFSQECSACHGTRLCRKCGGNGEIQSMYEIFPKKCRICDGTGICQACK